MLGLCVLIVASCEFRKVWDVVLMGKKLKTYSEELGEKPIDWRAWINREIARIGDRITLGRGDHRFDSEEMYAKSGSWVTCACGNQCSIIPRVEGGVVQGEPEDSMLAMLGIEFHHAISRLPILVFYDGETMFEHVGFLSRALELLEKIEARSAVLIDMELKKRKGGAG